MDEQTQISLELTYSKNQMIPRIKDWFNTPDLEAHTKANDIPLEFALDLLAQMVIHQRASISVLVGILHDHMGEALEDLQACADMIWKCAELDIVDYDPTADLFLARYGISDEVRDEISLYQYPLPLVVPPKPVTHNRETGYYTIKGSVLLNHAHHDDDVCLDHLNRVNRIPLRINVETVRMVQNLWKNLEKLKPGETVEEFNARRRAFAKYDQDARAVLEGLITMGSPVWLTHRYDSRGRVYAQGYHVNPQGNQWNKAAVEFDKQELVQ